MYRLCLVSIQMTLCSGRFEHDVNMICRDLLQRPHVYMSVCLSVRGATLQLRNLHLRHDPSS